MITLDELKLALRVSNNDENAELQRKLDSAVAECTRYLNLTDDKTPLDTPDVINGIVLIVQADYEGDPLRRNESRAIAETLWMPHRLNIGF